MTWIEDVLLPPNDFELEKNALSIIVSDISYLDLFDEDCFYYDITKKIFRAIKKTKSSDFSLIANESWLSIDDVIDSTTNLISSDWYDFIISEIFKYKNARLIVRWTRKLEIQARALEIDWAIETLKQIENSIDFINKDKSFKDIGLEYYDDIFVEKKNIKTWYKLLDDLVDIYWWQLITIAWRPWMWKTTIMQNLALRQSKYWKVWFISLEMQVFELMDRFVCIVWWLTSYDMKNKKTNVDKIMENLWDIMENKLFITENSYNLTKIEQYIKKNNLDVCYIDYLGLIQHWDSKMPIITRISQITMQLKNMAKRYNCAIILWSQLSREVEKRTDKRPVLSDLRDSWTIEQDSDIVIMAYRDDYYDEQTEDKNKLELLVRKQRNGKTGTIKLDSKFSSYRIIDSWVICKPF